MQQLFLYKVLVGCKPLGRHTEQHDVFFGIAESMQALVPQLTAFWPEGASSMHIDAFRKVTVVGEYSIQVVAKDTKTTNDAKLFFINLGGYKPNEFEEYHYKMIVAATDKATAIQQAKQTTFYKHTGFVGAPSHVDDKYGIDVDDVYAIEEVLSAELKEKYSIAVTKNDKPTAADAYNLGYYKLSKIAQGNYTTD